MEIRLETVNDNEIAFSWEKVAGADSYRLLWKDRKRDSMRFKPLKETTALKGVIKKMPRIPYYVKVQALKGTEVLAESNAVKTPVAKGLHEQLEDLKRGLVVVNSGRGIFVSWRLFKNEVTGFTDTGLSGTDFVIFKNGEKLAVVTDSTNFLDEDGKDTDVYSVVPFEQGKLPELSLLLAKEKEAEHVTAWKSGKNFLDIPVRIPEGGVTVKGDPFVYHINDISVGDVDGDGEYEYIVKWDPSNSKDVSQRGYTGKVYLEA